MEISKYRDSSRERNLETTKLRIQKIRLDDAVI